MCVKGVTFFWAANKDFTVRRKRERGLSLMNLYGVFFFLLGHRGAGGTNPSTGSSGAGHQVSILCKLLFMSEAPCETETSTKIHQNTLSLCYYCTSFLTFTLFSIFSFPHPLCRRPPQAYRSWYQARGVRACKRDPHGPVWDRSPGHCGSHRGGGPEIPRGGCYVHRKWGRGAKNVGPCCRINTHYDICIYPNV